MNVPVCCTILQLLPYCKLQTANCKLQTANCKLQTATAIANGNTYYTTPQKAMRNNFCKQFLTDVPIKIGIINKISMKQNTCPNNNFTIVSYLTGH